MYGPTTRPSPSSNCSPCCCPVTPIAADTTPVSAINPAALSTASPTIRSRSHSERPRRLSSAAVVSAALAALAAPTTARISTSIASAVTVVEPTSMAR